MKSLCFPSVLAGIVALSLALVSPQAHAQTYTDTFPSNGSTVVGSVGHIDGDTVGWFWSASRGDKVSEVFSSTGLNAIDGLDLEFTVDANVLSSGAFVNWDVRVNGNTVGTWTRTSAQGTGLVNLSYSFAPIVGAGTYDIGMFVTNNVAGGFGSISLAKGGEVTLHGASNVPEPGTMALLGSGVLGLVAKLRRRKSEGETVEA